MSWHREEVGNAPLLFRGLVNVRLDTIFAYGNMMYYGRGQMNWSKKSIWSNNNEVMFNVLGFECKPEEKICKNTGHFWEKD